MLRVRIITALVLLVLFGLDLFHAPGNLFALSIAAIVAAGGWEWSRLAGVQTDVGEVAYASLLGVLALICLSLPPSTELLRWSMLAGLLFWMCVPAVFVLRPVLPPIMRTHRMLLLLPWYAPKQWRRHQPRAAPVRLMTRARPGAAREAALITSRRRRRQWRPKRQIPPLGSLLHPPIRTSGKAGQRRWRRHRVRWWRACVDRLVRRAVGRVEGRPGQLLRPAGGLRRRRRRRVVAATHPRAGRG